MVFKSPHTPVNIPDQSITDYVLRNAESLGDKPALIDGPSGRSYSYAQLPGLISRLAAGLRSLGLKKGEVFAIYSPNLPEFALAFHAVATLGAATTMVPPLFTNDEIIKQLKNSGAKYLLTVPQLADTAQLVARAAGISQLMIIGGAPGFVSFSSLLAETPLPDPPSIDAAVDCAALPYSSGTTGYPKGVMLTHRNLVAMLRLMEANQAFTRTDTMICVVPMYHLYGLHIVVNLGLSEGATIVTLPRYDLEQFLQVLEKYKVTVAPLVPSLVLTLSQAPQVDQHDLSSIRLIHCGAAMLADNVAQDCSRRLGCEIRYGYGMTELSPLSHASLPDATTHRAGSVGFCLPNTECKIVDYNDNSELDANQQGEIWVRGPQVMKGYLGNQKATAEMMITDGWLRTGDIGYCDDQGRLFVVDRLKELIKVDGRQVAPAELEAVLFTHPNIADVAVVASPDHKHGEVPKAFVVLKQKTNAEEIIDYVAQKVARYKRIRLIEFVDEIPKSPAGKTLRRVLRDKERRAVQQSGEVSN
ncbi:MAG TPA: AMP-binding protein [Pyrinomonadaceae bacterium]|nr:AMP-binding protein [Pyrinomonadaceae bacterium]